MKGKTRPIRKDKPHRGDDKAKVAWLHTLPCDISGRRPVEVHHDRKMGAKATDKRTVPLHAEYHRIGPYSVGKLGRQGFEKHHGISMDERTAFYEAQWQLHKSQGSF